jgi:hypothetical protein
VPQTSESGRTGKNEAKRLKKLEERQKIEEWWEKYHADQLKNLKELNQEEAQERSEWKELCKKELMKEDSVSGSEGHLLTHPDEVPITLAGDQSALSRAGTTLSEENNNTFTWSGPSVVLGCTGQRRGVPLYGGVQPSTQNGRRLSRCAIERR